MTFSYRCDLMRMEVSEVHCQFSTPNVQNQRQPIKNEVDSFFVERALNESAKMRENYLR